MFIETSDPRVQGDNAFLMSPLLNKTNVEGMCFTFWYHMFGATIGTLKIYMDSPMTGRKLVWALSGDKGNRWFNGQVNVGTTGGTYQVRV